MVNASTDLTSCGFELVRLVLGLTEALGGIFLDLSFEDGTFQRVDIQQEGKQFANRALLVVNEILVSQKECGRLFRLTNNIVVEVFKQRDVILEEMGPDLVFVPRYQGFH